MSGVKYILMKLLRILLFAILFTVIIVMIMFLATKIREEKPETIDNPITEIDIEYIIPLVRVGHEVDEYLNHDMKKTSKIIEVVSFYYWLYENGYRIVKIKE